MLKIKTLAATLALALTACSMSAKAELAVLDTVLWGDSTYLLIEAGSWDDSEARAIELGGHLVTISDEQENDFIYNYWGFYGSSTAFNASYLWTGMNDAKDEGVFVWSSGENVGYTNFNPGEPNGDIRENYVHFWTTGASAGTWNDLLGSRGDNYGNVGINGVVEIKNFGNNANISANDVPLPLWGMSALGLLGLCLGRKSKKT